MGMEAAQAGGVAHPEPLPEGMTPAVFEALEAKEKKGTTMICEMPDCDNEATDFVSSNCPDGCCADTEVLCTSCADRNETERRAEVGEFATMIRGSISRDNG